MGLEPSLGTMDLSMKGTFTKMICTGKGHIHGLMDVSMKESGGIIKWKGKGLSYDQTGGSTSGSIRMTKRSDEGCFNGLTGGSMKASETKGSSTEKELLCHLQALPRRAFGRMEKG